MPTFTIRDDSGRTLKIRGDSEPTEDELEELFSSMQESAAAKSESEIRVTNAPIPDSLQLKPQFDRGTSYGMLAQPPPIPEFETRAEAEGGSLGDFRKEAPPRLVPTDNELIPGVTIPRVEGEEFDQQAGEEIKRQGAVGRFIEETAQAPIRIGMMRKNEKGEYETEMGPTEVVTGDEVNPRYSTAFSVPLPSDVITRWATKEGAVQDASVGMRNAAAGFLNFFLSPQGVVMTGMGGGAGAANRMAGINRLSRMRGDDITPFLIKLRDPANRGLASAFALDMARHAPEALQAGDEAMKRGDLAGAIESWMGGATQLALAGMSAKHAITPRRGGRDASKVSETAEVHGDVRVGEAGPLEIKMPIEEGRPRVQPQAEGRIQEQGPLTPEEVAQYNALQKKFFEGGEMAEGEVAALDAFDARKRVEMQARATADLKEMLDQSIKNEKVGDKVQFVEGDTAAGGTRSSNVARFNDQTGKIEFNLKAIEEDTRVLSPEQKREYIKSLVNEEAIHSRTTLEEALEFIHNSTWMERGLARRIYGKQAGKGLSHEQLAYEMVRRRLQHLNKMTPTEIAFAVGKERWTVKSLDALDRIIKNTRDLLGTGASARQIEILDTMAKNIGIAKDAAAGMTVGAPRREVEELAEKAAAGYKFANNREALEAGLKAESIDDLNALLEAKLEIQAKLRQARDSKDMQTAFRLIGPNQFLREAIEAATNSGSQSVARRVGADAELPAPKLDYTKNPEVADWLRENGKEVGISIEGESFGAPRRPSASDNKLVRDAMDTVIAADKYKDIGRFTHELDRAFSMARKIENYLDARRAYEILGLKADQRYTDEVKKKYGTEDVEVAFAEMERDRIEEQRDRERYESGEGMDAEQRQAISDYKETPLGKLDDLIGELNDWIESRKPKADQGEAYQGDLDFGAPRREGMSKAEARRIEEQRKYRELMIAKGTGGKRSKVEEAGAAMAKRHEKAYEPPTPESVQSFAQQTLGEKVPTFEEFVAKARTRHGDLQPGQLTEQWTDAVWKKLEGATGAELEQMVDNLGLRRQVFGKIRQGSKTFGLPEGPPPTLARTGKIADATPDIGGIELGRAKALERSARLAKKAAKMRRTAESPVSELIKKTDPEDYARQVKAKQELAQKAVVLQRTADNLAEAAQRGEGMPAQQQKFHSLFGVEEVRPADWRDPIKGGQRRMRDRAISAIARQLLSNQPSIRKGLNRKELDANDVRWEETGAEIIRVVEEDLADLDQLGMELTRGAASDASTKRIAGGGRFVVKEQALPRSATKRVVALQDRRTGEVHLVSAYRDGRRGPVFLDPRSVTGEHRSLQQLVQRYRPMFSIPLDTPVQGFKETFKSRADMDQRFSHQIDVMSRRIGWRGIGSSPRIEGSEAIRGEGGLFQGPEAVVARAEAGMERGARDMGIEITPQEARAAYHVFRMMETRADAERMIAGLRDRAQKNQLTPKDWLVITAMTKVNDYLRDLTPESGRRLGEEGKKIESEGLYQETLDTLYDLAKRNETEGSFVRSSERQFTEGPRVPAEAGPSEAGPSKTSRELTMPIERRPPTDVREENLPPGTKPVQRVAPPPADVVGGGLPVEHQTVPPGSERELYQRRSRERRIREGDRTKRQAEIGSYPASGRTAAEGGPSEIAPPVEPAVRIRRITRDVNEIANEVADSIPPRPTPAAPTPEAAGPTQGELSLGAPRREYRMSAMDTRRLSERKEFWEFQWKNVTDRIGERIGEISKAAKEGLTIDNGPGMRSELNGLEATLRTFLRDAGMHFEGGEPVWEGVRNDRVNQAAHFLDLLSQAEELQKRIPQADQSGMEIGSPRREPGTTLGERVSNILTDFGGIYDTWMVDRIRKYGGATSRNAARTFNQIIDRQKELYGSLTPTLDRARRLSGGVETNQGTNLRSTIADLPRQVTESARAMRAATWLGGMRRITNRAATARIVDAIEGNIPVPAYAQQVVDVGRAANLEIGRMLQPVVPGFVATGRFQRNLTGLGFDIVRMGGGPLWREWTRGTAAANRMHGATRFGVESDFTRWKQVLDDPMSTAEHVEQVNQDMARSYPNVVTHVRHLGRWQEVVHSNLFNYLEQTAQRATHVRAFREQFPNDTGGNTALRALYRDMRAELAPEVQRDLDGLMRSLNGHPTDEYTGAWQDYTRLGPQQAGGTILRNLNQTVNNFLAKAALTGQMVTQTPEMFFGATPQKLGYRNYLRGLARVRQLYNELELIGAVNRVMHDYTFSPSSPIRSIFRSAGNVLSKATMQAALNELQEALAASTARVVTDRIVSGRLSAWEQGRLQNTFREMGFTPGEVQRMMRGDQALLDQFQRKSAAFLTGGNKAIAEGSRLGANRMFNSIFRFQTYPMIKANQARTTITNFVDAWRTGNRQQRIHATESLARFAFGNTMQGAMLTMLASLAFGGKEGAKIRAQEAKDEPWEFLAESFLASVGGPLYILWRGARHKGAAGVGEQALRAAFPYSTVNDVKDMVDGVGQYQDKSWWDKAGTFVAAKTPGMRVVKTGLSMAGLANPSQELDQAIKGYNRWFMDTVGYDESRRKRYNDEREQFRVHVGRAIEAMKDGDEDTYIDEWLKAADVKDAKSFRQSMDRRKVLLIDGRKLTEEEVQSLQNRIGIDAYNRLEWYDAMLDAAAAGAIPSP